jgi:DNA mismatch endonuclease (patch repair protein)
LPDVFTKAKRSEVMSRIRGRGNKKTELALAKLLRAHGVTGWRRHQPMFGRPDFAFRRERVVVFVDGCFWHGCPTHSNMPVNNRPFWEKKLGANRVRDRLVTLTLRKRGWVVLRIWEHELAKDSDGCVRKITTALDAGYHKRSTRGDCRSTAAPKGH